MSTQQTEALPALIERFRGLHFDHAPDGWPAVRTREITALLARITELESQLAQRFDAADMATAAAQGFRDGRNQGKPMTKPELIRLMRLLSGMESILLFSGMQHLNQRAHIPDYLLEELTALTEVLEREILK